MLAGPSAVYLDNRGVVQPLTKGKVNCVAATHKHAKLFVLVRKRTTHLVENGLWLKVTWVKARTAKENAHMSAENRQIYCANEEADELARSGAE